MKSFTLLSAIGLLAAQASAWGNHHWSNQTHTTVTITTDIYTTICPSATTWTHGTKTYTATESETITVTDCPCTLTTSYPAWGTGKPTSHPWTGPTGVHPPPPPPPGTGVSVPPTTVYSTTHLTTYLSSSKITTIGNKTVTLSSGINTVHISTPVTTIGTVSPSKTHAGPTTSPIPLTNAAARFEIGGVALIAAVLASFLL